jgi:excinuclease ABC subunit A
VVDRKALKPDSCKRQADSIETANPCRRLVVKNVADGSDIQFSQKHSCPACGISIEELTPPCSPSSTPSALPRISGLGYLLKIDRAL